MASAKKTEALVRQPAEVRADMDLARAQVRRSVDGLREEVTRLSNWRQWFAQRPLILVGSAVVAGFVLGRKGSPRLATAIVGLGVLGELAMHLSARKTTTSTGSLGAGRTP